MVLRLIKGLVPVAAALWLAACGGGGGSSSSNAGIEPVPTALAVETSVDVTPALGGVSAGVLVSLFDAQSGALLASAVTQQVPLGTARLTLRDFQGNLVVKVEGAPGATYYDERSGSAVPFPAGKPLLAVASGIGGGTAASLGVTHLTHAVSAMLGVTAANFSGSGGFAPPATPLTSARLNAKTDELLAHFGLSRADLDLAAKPVVFGTDMVGRPAAELKLAGSGHALSHGALLTALAKTIPAGQGLVDAANTIAARAALGTLSSSGYLDTLGSRFLEVVNDNLGSGVPLTFKPVIGPGGAGAGAGSGGSAGSAPGGGAGGAGSGGSGGAVVGASLEAAFPVGLAVGSPTELGSATSATQATPQAARGWFSRLWGGEPLPALVAEAVGLWLPAAQAQSSNPSNPGTSSGRELLRLYQDQRAIDDLLTGSITLGQALGLASPAQHAALLRDFITPADGRAPCFAPAVAYRDHPDTQSSAADHHGSLPAGELGLWTAVDAGSADACTVAQLNKLLAGPRAQAMTGLKVAAAALVAATRKNGGKIPAVGSTLEVGSDLASQLDYPAQHSGARLGIRRVGFTALTSGAYLTAATLVLTTTLDGSPSTLELQLRLLHFPALANAGASSARVLRRVAALPSWAERLARLLSSPAQAQSLGSGGGGSSVDAPVGFTGNGYGFPGASNGHSQVYSGLLQIAHRLASPNPASLSIPSWQLSSVAYQRLDEQIYVKARSGRYAGDSANADIDPASSALLPMAAYQHNGELDPSRSQDAGYSAGHYAAWKWTGGFTRLGSQFNVNSLTGALSLGWVAGVGGQPTRLLNVLVNDAGGSLGGVAFFGLGNPVQGARYAPASGWSTLAYDGLVAGFVCNPTGVGQANGPARGEFNDRAQLQIFGLSASQQAWRPSLSALAYAPTSSCSDTGLVDGAGLQLQFDQADSRAASGLSLQPGLRAHRLQQKRDTDESIKDYIRDVLGNPGFVGWI